MYVDVDPGVLQAIVRGVHWSGELGRKGTRGRLVLELWHLLISNEGRGLMCSLTCSPCP